MGFSFYGDPDTPDEGFARVPEGERVLEVTEATEGKSQDGDRQVAVTLEDTLIRPATMRHYVTFKEAGQPGHGIAKHWLKVMTGSCDGDMTVKPEDWKGVRIRALVFHAPSQKDKTKIYANLDINAIAPYDLGPEDVKEAEDSPF